MKQKQINRTEWKEIELGDKEFFEILSSGINQFKGEKDYLSTESIKGTKIKKIECKITYLKRPSRANMQPILNSIWFAKMQNTLKVYCFDDSNKEEIQKYILSTGFAGVKVNDNDVFPKYLKLIFASPFFNREKNSLCTGSTQKGINNAFIRKIKIPLPFSDGKPDLEKQKQIVAILENLEKLKEKRKKTIAVLDDYLKSVFNEMFVGKGFEEVELGKVAPLQGGFAFKSKDYQNTGVNLIRINNVWEEFISWHEKVYLPKPYLKKYKDFLLNKNDLVLSMTRPIIKSLNSVKIAQIRGEDLPCLLNQRVGRFLIKKDEIQTKYLLYFCYTKFFKSQIQKYSSTSLQPNVSSKQVNSIKIPLPSLALQKGFAKIAEKVEKQKEKQKQSLGKIEELFNSSLNKAFKGELI